MRVAVIGCGHFASVVATCLRVRGHQVSQDDELPWLLRADQPVPVQERPPGLDPSAQMYWVAYDVPLDATGAPDTAEIEARIVRWDAALPAGRPFLVSCQWPVGTTARLEARCPARAFVYVMENVRTASGVEDFMRQPMLVVGSIALPPGVVDLIRDLAPHIWLLSPESAELAKHTMNAFLALQIAFINEIARVAEAVDADAQAIGNVLCSDARVSQLAPLHPGGPFGGGSLQRDLLVLERLGAAHGVSLPIISAIRESNR